MINMEKPVYTNYWTDLHNTEQTCSTCVYNNRGVDEAPCRWCTEAVDREEYEFNVTSDLKMFEWFGIEVTE